ncbi:endonuclease domain-containing 1 protein-like [Puntigrus tetrazona]|uniref:endonuclease domain-containing 1 protein-like n=1 Tax=Puntigrus tetrazona TaxID=1606681 RepID=UPI001C8AA438|nr:endonuclease domain-containing 1 protein-like [Puntigrus tetrazona]
MGQVLGAAEIVTLWAGTWPVSPCTQVIAYNYTGRGKFDRPNIPWKIEPQLDPPVDDMTAPYNNQAIDEDYFKNEFNVNRGHLFPSCHAEDAFIAESTFTLTNIVPQYSGFNSGSWKRMEIESQISMNTRCIDNKGNNKGKGSVLAHVLTGAIPGKNQLNNRVNIPSHMWMAFCCCNNRQCASGAYWAPNEQERKNENNVIKQETVQELQQFLNETWKKNVQLFKNCTNVSNGVIIPE